MSKLIITGATGTGYFQYLLSEPPNDAIDVELGVSPYLAGFAAYLAALADPSVSYVTLILRREIPSWADLPSNASEKSKTVIIKDFTQYPEDVISQIADHDGCVWALGKSIQGLSEEEYMRIHVDFPMAAVEALKKAGVGSTEKPFSFVYVSGEGADPSQKSMFMWGRGKVRTLTKTLSVRKLTMDGYLFVGSCRGRVSDSVEHSCDQIIGRPPRLLLPRTRWSATESTQRYRTMPRHRLGHPVHLHEPGGGDWDIG
jgi:hypothetical protein